MADDLRATLQNAYLDAKIGVDPAENEPSEMVILSPETGASIRRAGAGWPGQGAASRAPRCLLYTSPSPRDVEESRMPSSA